MKLKYKVLLIIYITFMAVGLLLCIIAKVRDGNKDIFINDTINYELKGMVNREGDYHDEVYGYFLGVSNDTLHMFQINESTLSYSNKRGSIGSFIKIGDSIYKKKNSKLVTIYRDKKKTCTFYLE